MSLPLAKPPSHGAPSGRRNFHLRVRKKWWCKWISKSLIDSFSVREKRLRGRIVADHASAKCAAGIAMIFSRMIQKFDNSIHILVYHSTFPVGLFTKTCVDEGFEK